MRYPAKFSPTSSGGFVVTFRDIPEALTQGESESEAMDMAADALLTAMSFYFEGRRIVPLPSPAEPGERLIALPLSVTAKVLLLNEMVTQRYRPSELAKLMGVKPQEMTRLLNLSHPTKIDTVALALEKLGKTVQFVVRAND